MKTSKEAGYYIADHTALTTTRLAVLYVYPKMTLEEKELWIEKVWNAFNYIPLTSATNGFSLTEFIYRVGWEHCDLYCRESLYYALWGNDVNIDSEPRELDKPEKIEFTEICSRYFMWLSSKLGKSRTVTLSEVKSILNALGLGE